MGRSSGGKLVEAVAKQIERAKTTLVFTNVRSQTEYWFHALLSVRPKWEDELGIHHGSLDRKDRTSVENRLRRAKLRQWCVRAVSISGSIFHPSSK